MAGNFQRGNGDFPLDFGGQQIPQQMGSLIRWALIIVGLIVLFALLSFGRSVYTDWLWFSNLGFQGIFVKILTTRILLFFVGAIVFGALLGISLYAANRASDGPVNLPLPPEAVDFLRRLVTGVTISAGVVLSIIFGAVMASRWESFLRSSNAVPFARTDPVFNNDLSFYVFTLPMLNFLQGWLLGAAIVILLGTVGLYFVRFNLRGVGFAFTSAIKVHVSAIAAIIMFIIAWGHWLDRWGLLLSNEGAVFGAAYTDMNARMPGLLILTIIAVASGVLMLVNAYLRGLRLLVGAVSLWVAMAIILGSLWPSLMQQFTVDPNEFVREQPFISRNIEFTREGFALNRIQDQFFPANSEVDADLVRRNIQTISNIRLWDYRPLSDVYRQIQLIRPYYEFTTADVDRYMINGELRQVLLAAREVAPEKLAPQIQTWTNTKLVYTHGIGIAMSPATEFTPEGRPEFFAQDIPANGVISISDGTPGSEPELLITNPRIYFGENTLNYVIANTETAELDYAPSEGDPVRNYYDGTGGVQLSSLFRRIAYAWQFGDINILISGQITGESRLQYRRPIQERIRTVAPFLMLDQDPYIVAADGQLYWIQDAYTISDQFPYSDPIGGGLNYVRNSVKVVVDAFNGTMRFYIWDTPDPVIMTYANIFPDLFLSQDEMPDSLQSHVRYPEDFFRIQTEKYIRYHMQNPQDFYNNEDLWAIAEEKFGQEDNLQLVEPYYAIMRLSGETEEEFVLLMPYTPNGRQNLVGWLAARSDGDNYGSLIAFNFPRDRQVDGTAQVEARIDNDPEISAWFTLRCSEGASCIRGNLLVVPVEQGLIYAEPVYIQAQGVSFPELSQVILATASEVVMQPSLDQALAALVGDTGIVTRPGVNGPTPPVEPVPVVVPPNMAEEIQSLRDSLQELIEGEEEDLAQYRELLEALDRLTESTGSE